MLFDLPLALFPVFRFLLFFPYCQKSFSLTLLLFHEWNIEVDRSENFSLPTINSSQFPKVSQWCFGIIRNRGINMNSLRMLAYRKEGIQRTVRLLSWEFLWLFGLSEEGVVEQKFYWKRSQNVSLILTYARLWLWKYVKIHEIRNGRKISRERETCVRRYIISWHKRKNENERNVDTRRRTRVRIPDWITL